jgi:hypothetical protein
VLAVALAGSLVAGKTRRERVMSLGLSECINIRLPPHAFSIVHTPPLCKIRLHATYLSLYLGRYTVYLSYREGCQ